MHPCAPRIVQRSELDGWRKGGLEPSPSLNHRAKMLGAHLGNHGALGQGNESDGQRARVRVAVQTNATSKGLLEALEGEIGVVDEDDEVRLERSGRAAGEDVVVRRYILLRANEFQVVRRETVLTPVNVADLVLTAQRAVSGLDDVARHADFEAIDDSDFLTISE